MLNSNSISSGTIGVAFSGALIWSPYAGGNTASVCWTTSAMVAEGVTFDMCAAHVGKYN